MGTEFGKKKQAERHRMGDGGIAGRDKTRGLAAAVNDPARFQFGKPGFQHIPASLLDGQAQS
jgi:hypothetical protein